MYFAKKAAGVSATRKAFMLLITLDAVLSDGQTMVSQTNAHLVADGIRLYVTDFVLDFPNVPSFRLLFTNRNSISTRYTWSDSLYVPTRDSPVRNMTKYLYSCFLVFNYFIVKINFKYTLYRPLPKGVCQTFF